MDLRQKIMTSPANPAGHAAADSESAIRIAVASPEAPDGGGFIPDGGGTDGDRPPWCSGMAPYWAVLLGN